MRRRPEPDTRPDWRDPNMPVLVKTRSGRYEEWAPDAVQQAFARKLRYSEANEWLGDPSYHWRRARRERRA